MDALLPLLGIGLLILITYLASEAVKKIFNSSKDTKNDTNKERQSYQKSFDEMYKGKTFKNNSTSKIEYNAQHPSNIKYATDDKLSTKHHKDDIPWEEEIDSIESDIFDDA